MWSSLKSMYYVTCTIVITTYIATCICACITTARMYMYYHYCTIQPLLPMYYYKYSSIIYLYLSLSVPKSSKFKFWDDDSMLRSWMNGWMNLTPTCLHISSITTIFTYYFDYSSTYLLILMEGWVEMTLKS